MSLKPGVRLLGLRPEMAIAHTEIALLFLPFGHVISGGIEGTHSYGSEHYTGLALDYRLHQVPPEKREVLYTSIKDALGADFDVLWEARGTSEEHLHVEYDPKAPY